MKNSALLALLAPLTQAHYILDILVVGDKQIGEEYSYTRKNTNKFEPSYPDILNSPDHRCNRGAKPGSTKTYTVKAGEKVGFKLNFNGKVQHPGPGFVYVSKPPSGSVNDYDGSGDWIKVVESGLCKGNDATKDENWCTFGKDRIEWTIPKDFPGGELLVRPEHIAIHEGHIGKAQFYFECTQLKIEGGGSADLGPGVKIPALYKSTDPGIAYNKWPYGGPAKPYVMPGPPLWKGAGKENSNAEISSKPVSKESEGGGGNPGGGGGYNPGGGGGGNPGGGGGYNPGGGGGDKSKGGGYNPGGGGGENPGGEGSPWGQGGY